MSPRWRLYWNKSLKYPSDQKPKRSKQLTKPQLLSSNHINSLRRLNPTDTFHLTQKYITGAADAPMAVSLADSLTCSNTVCVYSADIFTRDHRNDVMMSFRYNAEGEQKGRQQSVITSSVLTQVGTALTVWRAVPSSRCWCFPRSHAAAPWCSPSQTAPAETGPPRQQRPRCAPTRSYR